MKICIKKESCRFAHSGVTNTCLSCKFFVEESLKLYVWNNTKGYHTQVLFALATSVEQAKELIIAQSGNFIRHDLKSSPAVYDYPVGFEVSHSG